MWSRLQDDYLHSPDPTPGQPKGNRWRIGVIKIIWTHVHENWETRNEVCHGTNTNTCELANNQIVKQETMTLYEFQH